MNKEISATALRHARLTAGISIDDAAGYCGKHRTTWARMEAGASRVCQVCYRLMEILGGMMPWDGWSGWEIRGGTLYQPGTFSRGLLPGHLVAVDWTRELVRELGKDVAQLRGELQRETAPQRDQQKSRILAMPTYRPRRDVASQGNLSPRISAICA